MNKSLYFAMAALAMLATPAAHAADEKFYAGVALSAGGSMTVQNGTNRFDNTNNPTSARLYGGYDVSEHFAVEAGYAHFGKFKFAAPVTVDLSAFYAAAKGRVALGESFSVFGKLGATRHSVDVSAPGGSGSSSETRPLIGIGADYRLGKNLSLALELTDYGTTSENGLRLKMRKLEGGVKFRF